jgi:lipoprotein-anchoring transpeptidase ErfK/SrfK
MKASPPLLALTALACATSACSREAPPGADRSGRSETAPTAAGNPTLPPELSEKPAASGAAANPAAPAPDGGASPAAAAAAHTGPWLVVTSPAAAVYSVRDFAKEKKIGYVKNGGRAAVRPTPEATKNCTGGWYEVIGGGYICANLGTTDMNHPQVKFAVREPNLDDVLPYVYARNAKNGTPLYKSVPSREQMDLYEPYLNAPKSESAPASRDSTPSLAEPPALVRVEPQLVPDAGLAMPSSADAGDPEADKKWWERENAKDRLHEVKLDHLTEDADDILAKRMVTGFYVAVDKTFNWNGRTWYKTTKGLVAPADRFWQTAGSKFKGVELGGAGFKLPVAWTYGGRKTAPLYEIEVESKKVKLASTVDVPTALQLTGREIDIKGTRYSETKDQKWIKHIHIRVTKPGPAPADLGPNERWIDVNLKQQTLVAFQGTTPVYATLVSTGKQSQDKDKDHRTPSGQWRIREKHITTTMDGDGSAAGDLPYSIEDVPYAMYFDGSYAVHGAFWHRNFGVQMSHGCVNLAPLDAKHLFFFADPQLPTGWHGIWSSSTRQGSRVVIHE